MSRMEIFIQALQALQASMSESAQFRTKFSGEKGDDIKYFIERFDRFCYINGKDDNYKVNHFPMHLTGRAQKLYSKLSDEIKEDYDILTGYLKIYFSPAQLPIIAAFKKLHSIKRNSSERIQDFYERLLDHIEGIEISDAQLMAIFISNFPKQIEDYIILKEPENLSIALKWAKQQELLFSEQTDKKEILQDVLTKLDKKGSVNNGPKISTVDREVRTNHVRRTTPQFDNEYEENRHVHDIRGLTEEIMSLKEVIASQDHIIDGLMLEKDQISDAYRALKMKYDNSFNKLAKAGGGIGYFEKECPGLTKRKAEINSLCCVREETLDVKGSKSLGIEDFGGKRKNKKPTALTDDRIDTTVDTELRQRATSRAEPTHTSRRNGGFVAPNNNVSKEQPSDAPDRRDNNIIIHGIKESNEIGYDEIYLKRLFTVMKMGQTSPTLAHRLGIRRADRPRPMKITMDSKDDKAKFMSQLGALKYAATDYRKIRVTDDYTVDEREEIRRWVEMANDRNTTDDKDDKVMMSYAWKVRGNPKIGMRIVKIRVQD